MRVPRILFILMVLALACGGTASADSVGPHHYSYNTILQFNSQTLDMYVDAYTYWCLLRLDATMTDLETSNSAHKDVDNGPWVEYFICLSMWLNLSSAPGDLVRIQPDHEGCECDNQYCEDWSDDSTMFYLMEMYGSPEAYGLSPAEGVPGSSGSITIWGAGLWGRRALRRPLAGFRSRI